MEESIEIDVKANTRIRVVLPDEKEAALVKILEIESECTSARQDTRYTERGLWSGGVAVVAEVEASNGWEIVGSALADSIELFSELSGPKEDPCRGARSAA